MGMPLSPNLVDSGEIKAGDNADDVARFLEMFGPFAPADNNAIPVIG